MCSNSCRQKACGYYIIIKRDGSSSSAVELPVQQPLQCTACRTLFEIVQQLLHSLVPTRKLCSTRKLSLLCNSCCADLHAQSSALCTDDSCVAAYAVQQCGRCNCCCCCSNLWCRFPTASIPLSVAISANQIRSFTHLIDRGMLLHDPHERV